MKTFKEYRQDKKKQDNEKKVIKPFNIAVFGKHSQKEVKPFNVATFGKHSQKTTESIVEGIRDEEPSARLQNHTHEVSAPLADNLSPEHHKALKAYTDNSTPMNNALHMYHQGRDMPEKHIKPISTLTHILNNHSTKNDIDVYTGVKFSPASHFEDGAEHAHVHFPAFTSTSTSICSAREFAEGTAHENDKNHGIDNTTGSGGKRHVLKISVPEGSPAASVKKVSFVPEEKEVLLNRGADIKIHRTPTKIDNSTYMWHGELVGHSPASLDHEDL